MLSLLPLKTIKAKTWTLQGDKAKSWHDYSSTPPLLPYHEHMNRDCVRNVSQGYLVFTNVIGQVIRQYYLLNMEPNRSYDLTYLKTQYITSTCTHNLKHTCTYQNSHKRETQKLHWKPYGVHKGTTKQENQGASSKLISEPSKAWSEPRGIEPHTRTILTVLLHLWGEVRLPKSLLLICIYTRIVHFAQTLRLNKTRN